MRYLIQARALMDTHPVDLAPVHRLQTCQDQLVTLPPMVDQGTIEVGITDEFTGAFERHILG